ncbi:MAG TPA: metal-dependent hydrolase [Symbiobacteriaceae bacterium]|jgi:membrane-bound metal-dependent hydrolase YbcI (DUF457 family)
MAQVGIHALTGLVLGEALLSGSVPSRTRQRALIFGYVLGNIVPDLDYLAAVGAYPVSHTLALHLHRGFSHSLLAALALLVGFFVSSWLMDDPYLRYLGYGLAAGVATHMALDIFVWFAPVDVFWPASEFGIIPPVNLWWWYNAPVLVGRLLGAFEFGAFGLYYDHLAKLAISYRTDLDAVASLERMATVCWITWAVLSALSLDVKADTYDIWFYIPMGLIFMPSCLYLTWRCQATIEQVGLVGAPLGDDDE